MPYSNHAPDLKQAKAELYVEDEEEDTQSIHFRVVDMINGVVIQQGHSPLNDSKKDNEGNDRNADRHSSSGNISLTDKVRRQRRQKKQQENTHYFNTAYSKRLFIAFVVLVALVGLALIVYFCWPRVPKVIIKSAKLERMGEPADWGPTQQPWLRAAWRMNVTIDNTVNFVPTRVSRVEWTLRDRDTDVPFAWSTTDATRFQPYSDTLLRIDFRVNYESPSVNDTTFKNLYNACGPQIPTETPALNVTMQAGRKPQKKLGTLMCVCVCVLLSIC